MIANFRLRRRSPSSSPSLTIVFSTSHDKDSQILPITVKHRRSALRERVLQHAKVTTKRVREHYTFQDRLDKASNHHGF